MEEWFDIQSGQYDMTVTFERVIHTVDTHTEGNPTRIVVGGVAVPPGTTVTEQNDWLKFNDDALRRLLNFEPRGNPMMCSVLILPPISEKADFSVVITEQDEYVPMSGHCIIGAATAVVATGLVKRSEPVTVVSFETPAGLVKCEVSVDDGRIGAVTFENVESFLLREGLEVDAGEAGPTCVDVAYGGCFYAIVDADALGVDISPRNETGIIAAARALIGDLNSRYEILHPQKPEISQCYQTLFYSQRSAGHVRQAIVAPPGALDRSPCGTGASAHLATLFAKGLVEEGRAVNFEGPLGTIFTGRVSGIVQRDGRSHIVPRVSGRGYITGFHQFVLDADDPFPEGFRVGDPPRDQRVPGVWGES